ncbi:MAG: hypothetical protein U9N77_05375 [Thermodesulfobacteriota bacterium]|nr:hypothetical protein [Thermodesulfobacteriota bacterium]
MITEATKQLTVIVPEAMYWDFKKELANRKITSKQFFTEQIKKEINHGRCRNKAEIDIANTSRFYVSDKKKQPQRKIIRTFSTGFGIYSIKEILHKKLNGTKPKLLIINNQQSTINR